VWTFSPPPGVISMDWFWRAGVSLLAATVAFPIGRAIATRSAWARRSEAVRTIFGLAFGVMGWCTLYMVFALVTTPRGHAPRPDHETSQRAQ
jgi:hypothetical protein